MFCNKYRPTENVVSRAREGTQLLRFAQFGVDQRDFGGREGAAREVAEVMETGIVAQPRAQLVPGRFRFHAREILGGQFCTAECFDVFVHIIMLLFIWVQNYKKLSRITNENSL